MGFFGRKNAEVQKMLRSAEFQKRLFNSGMLFNAAGIQKRLYNAGLIMSTNRHRAWGYKNGKPAKLSLHFTNVNSQKKLENFRNQKLRHYTNELQLNINELKKLSKVLNTNNNINMLRKIRLYYQAQKK